MDNSQNKKFEAEYVKTEPIQPNEIGLNSESQNESASAQSNSGAEKIKINIEPDIEKVQFLGREMIEAKAPKTIKALDQIVNDWKHEGDFSKVDLGLPLAESVLGVGLRKAKKVEKKLEEKGVFMMAQIGIEYAKSKLKLK